MRSPAVSATIVGLFFPPGKNNEVGACRIWTAPPRSRARFLLK